MNSTYYGQGQARIYISDFESYHRFIVSQILSDDAIVPIDLSKSNVVIVFNDLSGNKVKIPASNSTLENSSSQGVIIFKIPGHIKAKIFNSGAANHFYIVTEAEGAPETMIYHGSVDIVENQSTENLQINQNGSSSSNNSVNATSLINNATIGSVNQAVNETSPPLIPNLNYDANAASIRNGISPVSNTSTGLANSSITTSLSQASGSSTTIQP